MYKKNTAASIFFTLINSTTGVGNTGKSPTIYRTIDAGAQGAATGVVDEQGNGQYRFNATAVDMNGNHIGFLIVEATSVPVSFSIATTTKLMSDLHDISAADVEAQCEIALLSYSSDRIADTITALTNYDAATGADVSVSTVAIISEVERMIPGTENVEAGPSVVFRDSQGTGYDNAIQLSLKTQVTGAIATALSLADVMAMEFSIPSIDLVIRNENPSAGPIIWDEVITEAEGKVILSLGGEAGLPLGALIGWLITYNDEHPEGVVWGGASGIPFVVLEVPSIPLS